MAIHHAESGEVVSVLPLDDELSEATTVVLIKTDHLEVIRMVLPAGRAVSSHKIDKEITIQCVSGHVAFEVSDEWTALNAGQMLFIEAGAMHAVKAGTDSILLITIPLHSKNLVKVESS